MRFLTDEECRVWAEQGQLDSDGWPTLEDEYEGEDRVLYQESGFGAPYATALRLSRALDPWKRCLLWVRVTGVFEDGGNQHLYYRLRQSYGDGRLVEDVPGHLFLDYERADFVTFLQLVLENGWDAVVLTNYDYGRLLVSHDGYFEASFSGPECRAEFLGEPSGWRSGP